MSLVFTTSNYIRGPSNFSLPNSDWCLATVVRIDDNSGVQWNPFLTAGDTIGTGELDFSMGEDDRTGVARMAQLRIGDGANLRIVRSTVTGIFGAWALYLAQRASGEKQIWQSAIGGTPAKVAASSLSLGATSHNTPLTIARRSTNMAADNSLLGRMAYFAVGSFSLSADDIATLAAGICPRFIRQWDEYLPFLSAGQTVLNSPVGGSSYTVTGSPAGDDQPIQLW